MKTVPYLAILLISSILAYYLRFQNTGIPADYLAGILSGLLLASVYLPATGAFREEFRGGLARRSRRMFAGWALVVTSLVALAAIFKVSADYSRIWFGYWVMLGALGLFLGQAFEFLWRKKYARKHGPVRKLALVGAGEPLRHVRRQLEGIEGREFLLQGIFGLDDSDAKVLPLAGLRTFIAEHEVDDVWIALPLDQPRLLESALEELKTSVVDVHVIPDFEHYRLLNQGISEWAGLPFISLSSTPMTGPERLLKDTMDRLGALLLLVLLSPVLLMIAAGIRLSGPGAILFHQKRHGFGGEVIDVLKFRTMHVHKEPRGKVVQAHEEDSRVTSFGRFLRKTSLDELPQLINVLLGQMSLVGPRPHALEHNQMFQDRIPRYMLRHKVKPGMTGWAQVNGLRGLTETDEKMALRIEHDLWYIQNWSIWLDITILMRTPFVMIHRNAF